MKRAIFIDRDGTISEEVGYINHLSRFHPFEFAAEAVRLINRAGWRAILVTNQSGLARGYFTEELLGSVHAQLRATLARGGASLDAIYYCPHQPSADCDCRKPRPGLLARAAADFGLDLQQCYVVGDRYLDVALAHRVGAAGVLVLTGYGRGEYEDQRAAWPAAPQYVAENLLAAVQWILSHEGADLSRCAS